MNTAMLAGKRILVTGASRGLGRAMCRTFARQGADVAFSFAKDQKGAAATLAAIEAEGVRALRYQVSVLDSPGLDRMAADLETQWGGIDILVNNAGMSQVLPLALMEEEDWDELIDTNVKGYFLTSKSLIRGMIRRKHGVILNVGSIAGMRLLAAPIHYAASKAAVRGYSDALSKEVARYNIRVVCLAPGVLEEGVASNLPGNKLQEYLKQVALGRVGTCDEVARFAAFMISDRASYLNGTTVTMDGGL
jgi:3-oxoacyl-[acyl-carrier protein] reductase